MRAPDAFRRPGARRDGETGVSVTQPGSRLGKYEIRGTLGKGAMGTVYDGWDPIIARRVAIKTVKIPDAHDAEAVEELARFRREAQAAGRLTHPNIVGVYDYGEDGDIAFIVMEFVDGPTLKGLLKDQARMALPDIVRVMDDVLTGLAFSHARGIVHRDIKPANVMMSSDGRAKIADFGIARIESSSMTQAGTVMGTPAYMSPEQFMGQTVDARTDLYSAGVLLYELLTGEKPFEGGMTAIMHKALHTDPPRPSDISVTSPPAMDAVVAKAMAKRPENRFANAEAFAAAMRQAASAPAAAAPAAAEDDEATMVSAPARPAPAAAPARAAAAPRPAAAPAKPAAEGRSMAPIAAGVGLAVVLGGAGAWFVLGRGGEAPPPPVSVATAPISPPGPAVLPPPATPEPLPVQPTPPVVAAPSPQPPPVVMTPQPQPQPPPVVAPPQPQPQPPPVVVTPQPQPQPPPVVVTPQPQPPPVVATPQPQPQPTPGPLALAPVTPPPQPAPTPAVLPLATQVRNALATSLPTLSCSLVSGTVTADRVTLRGVVGRGSPERALRETVTQAAGSIPRDWRVNSFDAPFCSALDALRPIVQGFGSAGPMHVALANNATRLRDGELITISVTGPDFPAYLMVSFLVHDGTLAHLHPTPTDPARPLAPGATMRLGDPSIGGPAWAVGPPYGSDMIIAVASSAPLFDRPRPDDEDTSAYLRDLRAAIAAARARGVRLAADAWVLETVPR